MLDYNEFIKSTSAYKNSLIDFEKDRLAHTYLIENQDMNLCFSFAKFLSKLIIKGNKVDENFQNKLEKNIHPDIKIYGLEKKIMVDDASEIVSDVFVMPFEEDKKVYILLDAENMTVESQNKLLKTLEEPPMSSYFVLCAKSEKTLLQTVISRSKKVVIENPSVDDIFRMLVQSGASIDNAKIASVCACSDSSKAEKMVNNTGFMKVYAGVFEMFRTMNTSRDILKFASKFSSRDFQILDFLAVTETVAMDLLYILAGTDNLVLNKHKITELKMTANMFSIQALTKILKECFDFRESLYYNVSITPALDEFLLKFVEVKVKCKK